MSTGNKMMSRQEIFCLQNEATFGTIPNTTGTATVSGANACAMIQFKMNRVTDKYIRKDKTGSRTGTAGIAGRKIANFSSNKSLVTSGVAGTPFDAAPIANSLFGATPTIKSGTATITAATNTSPISVTATGHGLSEYDVVTITAVAGNTAANGVWAVHVTDANTITLLGSTGNAAYTSGGVINKAACVWIPTDAQPSFTAYSFRVPSTGSQRAIFGAVAQQATFHLGEDIATWQSSGLGFWHTDSLNFSNGTLQSNGQLTAFPTVPGSIVTNGGAIGGFRGQAYVNGATIGRLRTAEIKYTSGLDLPRDLFGSDFVDIPEADERVIQIAHNWYEDDTAAQAALEWASATGNLIDGIYQVGTTPGNIFVFVIRGIQLASPDRDDSARAFTMQYGDSRAYGSGITAFNELRMWQI